MALVVIKLKGVGHGGGERMCSGLYLSQAPEAPTKKCHFFTIPPELCLEIHSLVLADHNITRYTGKLQDPPLLRACRLIRNESIEVYNTRMEAISQGYLARVEEAESVLAAKRRRRRNGHRGDHWRVGSAKHQATFCRGFQEHAAQTVHEKRRALREEGFRV
ncbi:hypothetical protein DOTSEDRAFT_18942 [Dothistroma septosporum NZE10]|uniref:Uncharacterized protein n=1 Tax=Dothistroma septosporum (strain NZE10 / CBS 128990) TaxID=675120 RepID=N1PY95_DOTSN|nr:hypothetical protein DOTSEDRAFT_18942 [Dothistroma septosporum NZE10]